MILTCLCPHCGFRMEYMAGDAIQSTECPHCQTPVKPCVPCGLPAGFSARQNSSYERPVPMPFVFALVFIAIGIGLVIGLAGGWQAGIIAAVAAPALICLYFLPTGIAWENQKKNLPAIALLNFFAGWSVIGWLGALIWAVMKD